MSNGSREAFEAWFRVAHSEFLEAHPDAMGYDHGHGYNHTYVTDYWKCWQARTLACVCKEKPVLPEKDQRITELEAEVQRLKDHLRQAGVFDYKADVFLGKATITGNLRKELTRLKELLAERDALLGEAARFVRIAAENGGSIQTQELYIRIKKARG